MNHTQAPMHCLKKGFLISNLYSLVVLFIWKEQQENLLHIHYFTQTNFDSKWDAPQRDPGKVWWKFCPLLQWRPWVVVVQSLQNKKFDLSIGRQVLRAVMAKQVKHTKGAILLSMHFTVCIKSATEAWLWTSAFILQIHTS